MISSAAGSSFSASGAAAEENSIVESDILAVTPTHHRVQRSAAGDHVGQQRAFGHRGDGLQVHEARVSVVHPVRVGATVRDGVHAELPARMFDTDINLAGRNAEALG